MEFVDVGYNNGVDVRVETGTVQHTGGHGAPSGGSYVVSSGTRVAGSASSQNVQYGGDMGNMQVRSDGMQMMSGGGGGGTHVVSGGNFSGGTEVRTSRRSHKRH